MEPPDPFADLADEARAGAEARGRAAARWLERSAAESATLVGTLLDLAERAAPVTVRTTSGRLHAGPVELVGADFVLVGGAHVRLDAVVAVRAASPATGDRAPTRDVRLTDVLAELAAERPVVVVVPASGPPVRGSLVAAGVDVLVVVAGDGAFHVPLGAVAEVLVVG